MSQKNKIDYLGQRFGTRTVVRDTGERVRGYVMWEVICDCGKTQITSSNNLKLMKNSECRSCSTRNRDINPAKTHGKTKTKEHLAWVNLRVRAAGKTNRAEYYVGIDVDPRWLESFETFLLDMGLAPSPHHSLDRVDGTKGYWPYNCRWATAKEQSNNRRNVHLITFDGETKNATEWALFMGKSKKALRYHILKGHDPVEVLTFWKSNQSMYTRAVAA
jgi:hypothetical protein